MLFSREAKNGASQARAHFDVLYADYTELWGWKPSERARQARAVVVALYDGPDRIRSELGQLTVDGVSLSQPDWALVVRQLAVQGAGLAGLQAMKDAGGTPSVQTFAAALKGLAQVPAPDSQHITQIVAEIDAAGLVPDEIVETLLLRAHDRAGDAEQVQFWTTKLESRAYSGTLAAPTWSSLLLHVGRQRGSDEALRLLGKMRELGLRPDGTALANLAIVRFEKETAGRPITAEQVIRDVYELEDRTGLKADKRAWQVALRSALGPLKYGQAKPAGLREGLAVYEEAMSAGARPDAEMVELLILSLCADPEQGYQRARAIYTDLLAAEDNDAKEKTRQAENRSGKRLAAATSLLQALLQACLVAEPPATRVSSAVEYLDGMRQRGITLPPGDVSGRIIGLMRAAADHYEAFKLYSYARALDPAALDQTAYSRIVIAFAHLSYPRSAAAPPAVFFELLRDMRRAGHQPTALVYTELISQYTQLLRSRRSKSAPAASDDRIHDQVSESLSRVHDTLKLDTFVDLDIPLLNALMDAYNQIGAWAECNEVWDELLSRKPFERDLAAYQPTLNIILDACGHAGAQVKARNIWRWAGKSGIPLNRKNHEAWLECLCRLGFTDEAAQLVCTDYKAGAGGLPTPDAEMLRLVLRFSWRKPQDYRELPVLVKTSFPELWETVKGEVETRRNKVA